MGPGLMLIPALQVEGAESFQLVEVLMGSKQGG